MTHSDVIIGHVVTSSVELYQEAPNKNFTNNVLTLEEYVDTIAGATNIAN